MQSRSQRSTQGKLPQHLKEFYMNMSGSSTPTRRNSENGNSLGNANDDDNNVTVVEQQLNNPNEMISCLMERIKTLEDNHQRTMQQLLQSEVKRAHLQEELSSRDAATKTPPPVVDVSHVRQQAVIVNNALDNNDIAACNESTVPRYTTNAVYTPVSHSQTQQPIVATTIMTSAGCPSTMPPYQDGNNRSNLPQSSTLTSSLPPSTGYPTMPCTTFMSLPHIAYTSINQTGMYTNAGLQYATNCSTSQPTSMPTHSNVFTPVGGYNYGATRKLYDLPEFYGRPEQWPVFITAFKESSNAYGYTALENTFRLQKCLKGVAREEVECLLINPQNVSQIIEQLEFKYGRPELLIRSQLQKIREIAPIHENQLEKILPFATKVQNLTAFLKSANANQHLSNPTLMEELISKMPMSKRMEWVSYSSLIDPFPTLEHFNAWINQMAKVIAKVTPIIPSTPPMGVKYQPSQLPHATIKGHNGQTRGNTKPVLAMNEMNNEYVKKQIYCVKCNDSHYLPKCDQFLKMPVDDRWNLVKSNRLCFSCLRKGHNLTQCKSKKSCHVNGCKKLHNATLHQVLNGDHEQVNMIRLKPFTPKTTKLLYKLVSVEIRGPNNKIMKTYAFLDEGSSSTLIHDSVALQMGFKEKKEPLTLSWFEGAYKEVSSMSVQLKIRGTGCEKRWYNLKAHSVPKLDLPSQTINLGELHDKFHQLKSLPIAGYTDVVPQILIGLDNCHLTPNLKSVQFNKCVIAANTPLGWAIYGHPQGTSVTSSCRFSVILHTREEEHKNIENIVADYFTTENFGVALPDQPLESKDVVRARQILKNTTIRVDGRYETGLLWRNDNVVLPNSYKMALSRLHSMEKKMKTDSKFANAYETAMTKYILSGYARKLLPSEIEKTTPHTWYLPHFAVFNVNKPGKLRLVFDAAAAVNGTSLNSVLLKGPDENQQLLKILFQFREGAIGVCADIKEMFLQIRIRETDQDAQRFLWRFSESDPVEIYSMVSMVFGATCSPCSAQYVKNLNAIENASDQPEVVDTILNSHYVDDMVCSFQNEEEALRISSAVKTTHARAGFQLRGFISNSSYVQNYLNEDVENQGPSVNMNTADAVEKILGMFWRSRTDEFIFKLQLNRVDPEIINGIRCPTKRELLCLVMSVYDPFGMLANLLVYGKILLQELWRTGANWDDAIPDHIYQRFVQWVRELRLAKQFRLSRCYSPQIFHSGTTIELHIFNDASQAAFASVAYWRIVTPNNIQVCFVAGKTKCAPLKVLSVPRLELQAAVLGTRLKNAIIESHKIKPSRTILWSDSKTVISWIKSDHRQYKAFVMHRVGEILESTHEDDWRWVPTRFNPADVATRTTYPVNYSPDNRWIKGPQFLVTAEEGWPKPTEMGNPIVNTEEERKKLCMVIITVTLIDFKRFSSYLRLQRTLGWVLRFGDVSRKRASSHGIYELTVSELHRAEVIICKLVQQEVYEVEINDLQVHGNVSKSSSIVSLTPHLNSDGVLCVNGRIDYALVLPESTRHPIILPYRHVVTELIVMWYHHKLFHQNDDLVVNEVRRKFWIPHLRSAVKRAKSKCQQCKNNRAKPKPPIMGQLPIDRLQPYVRPFTYTGLDYFGPINVTIGRRREKRWAALFTCLTIRAIHIELAADLSTDACIICIRNFVNRRGVPVKIRSDMGTNFVGADGELRRVNDLFDHNYIQNELATKNITCDFNCPANPSSGGCWERLVQSTKKVLAVTLKDIAPKVETLRSLLIEAENVVNSRPLTHIPVTPENPDPLTPNHFLLGTTNSTQTPGEVEPICSRKQYRISQQLKNRFWRRWIREYLPTLTKRTKWFAPQKPIEVNDVVIICDENLPRSQWRRGIVTARITARDGQTRIVEIRTSNGTLRRPVSKLAVLDVCSEVPQDLHEGRDVVDT